jgi:hypothetical protein
LSTFSSRRTNTLLACVIRGRQEAVRVV